MHLATVEVQETLFHGVRQLQWACAPTVSVSPILHVDGCLSSSIRTHGRNAPQQTADFDGRVQFHHPDGELGTNGSLPPLEPVKWGREQMKPVSQLSEGLERRRTRIGGRRATTEGLP